MSISKREWRLFIEDYPYKALFMLVGGLLFIPLYFYTGITVFNWVIPPIFGLQPISFYAFLGLTAVINFFKSINKAKKEKETLEETYEFIKRIYIKLGITFGLGFIASFFV